MCRASQRATLPNDRNDWDLVITLLLSVSNDCLKWDFLRSQLLQFFVVVVVVNQVATRVANRVATVTILV
jgi:hypothetical protein